eukprot:1237672-Alexandrium_andersonii.AAC.1
MLLPCRCDAAATPSCCCCHMLLLLPGLCAFVIHDAAPLQRSRPTLRMRALRRGLNAMAWKMQAAQHSAIRRSVIRNGLRSVIRNP